VTKVHIRGTASTGLGYDPLMIRKSPVGGLRPAYRVYLVSFTLGVAAMASFVAHVKVLGFVFVALMFAFAGITTVMLLASARQAKADLRATPRALGNRRCRAGGEWPRQRRGTGPTREPSTPSVRGAIDTGGGDFADYREVDCRPCPG
jgi:hypothetical protein